MQDVAHHHDVGVRQPAVEEVDRGKHQAVAHAVLGRVFLENRLHHRQIETRAFEVRVRDRHLNGEIALRRAGVDERVVLLPRELRRDRHVRAVADAAHRLEKVSQPRRVRVDLGERAGAAGLDLVLGQAGAQPVGEMVPEPEQAEVGHLENAADIRRLALVEKQVGVRGVRVDAAGAREEAERHQRIEEIMRRSRMQAEAFAEAFGRRRLFRQPGEELEFDRAQQRLRCPERETGLEDAFGADGRLRSCVGHVGSPDG